MPVKIVMIPDPETGQLTVPLEVSLDVNCNVPSWTEFAYDPNGEWEDKYEIFTATPELPEAFCKIRRTRTFYNPEGKPTIIEIGYPNGKTGFDYSKFDYLTYQYFPAPDVY
jgi:hypothetical protein